MLRGNLCLVADVLFQSDFLNWRSAHVEASDKGPAKGPSPWGSLRTVTMSATWNFAESKQVRFRAEEAQGIAFRSRGYLSPVSRNVPVAFQRQGNSVGES
jgi:hypothetical protein